MNEPSHWGSGSFEVVDQTIKIEKRPGGSGVVLVGGRRKLPLTLEVAAQLIDDLYDALQEVQRDTLEEVRHGD